ncbi:MAG: T9SS type A sorting domain-containing protein [Bacteroidales bacterium]|nr:T9SS type A sorting domain-containing protein [Bacteroidales bacterium]
MNRILLITLLLLTCGTAGAQTSVSSSGGSASGGGHEYSYNVGQVATLNASSSSTLHEGVMQPLAVTVERITEVSAIEMNVEVFPNPTTAAVTLHRNNDSEPLTVELYAQDGRLAERLLWDSTATRLNLDSQPSGIYILKVSNESKQSQTYKITKL